MKDKRTEVLLSFAVVAAALIGAAYYLLWMPREQAPATLKVPEPAAASGRIAGQPAPPPVEHPIENATAAAKPEPPPAENSPAPPPVDEPALEQALTDLLGAKAMQEQVIVQGFVQKLVATVDNLPRENVNRVSPLKPVGGQLMVEGEGENLTIAPGNAARYGALMHLLEVTDTRRLAELYVRFYPLFQHGYEELGYPGRYFNDRLVQVIDHLLQTPEPEGPVRLIQPKVMYQYADPSLESRSAGQKALIRLGNANAAKVKAKLKEFRGLITQPMERNEKVEHPE